METTTYVISPRVIRTIDRLPEADRTPIRHALSEELEHGRDPQKGLSPVQWIIYAMIRQYIETDTTRAHRVMVS